MATVTMTLEEYQALLLGLENVMGMDAVGAQMELARQGIFPEEKPEPRKRKNKYQAAYKRNFNKVKSKFLKKNGQWKQGGFKRAVKEAHRLTRK